MVAALTYEMLLLYVNYHPSISGLIDDINWVNETIRPSISTVKLITNA